MTEPCHAEGTRTPYWRLRGKLQQFGTKGYQAERNRHDSKGNFWVYVFDSRTAPICALSQMSLYIHTTTAQLPTISRFPCIFSRAAPHFFVSTIRQVIWPSPGTLVARTNMSCRTYERARTRHVTHMNLSCHIYGWASHVTYIDGACHNMWTRHVTHINEPCHIYGWTSRSFLFGVVQCFAACCCVLQCVAVCCNVLQCVAVGTQSQIFFVRRCSVCTYTYICVYLYVYIYIYIHIYTYMCMNIDMCMYICIYIYTKAYSMYIYVYKYTQLLCSVWGLVREWCSSLT